MKRLGNTDVWGLAGNVLSAAALICGGVMAVLIAWVTWLNLNAETAPFTFTVFYAAAGLAAVTVIVLFCRAVPVKNEARFCICLAVGAFAVRGLFVLLVPTEPVSDFGNMYAVAGALAEGTATLNGRPYFEWWAYQSGMVLWMALWIRLFGVGVGFFQTANCLCGAGCAVLVYALARRFASPRGARAAGLLYLIYPTSILLAPVLTNQHLSELLLLAALYGITGGEGGIKTRLLRGGTAGLLLAFSNVIRPAAIVAVLAVPAVLILELFHWKELGPAGRLAAAGGALAAVAVYVLATRGMSWLVQVTGLNHYGLENHVPQWKLILGLNAERGGRYSRADANIVFASGQMSEVRAAADRLLKERLAALTPGGLLNLFWVKIKTMWGSFEPTYDAFTQNVTGLYAGRGQGEILAWALNKFQRLTGGLCIAGSLLTAAGCIRAALKKEQGRQAALLLTLTALVYFCAHLLIEIQVRYRTLLFAVIFPLTAIGADWMGERWERLLVGLKERRKETQS